MKIKTFISDKQIIDREPILRDFLYADYLDYTVKIAESYKELLLDLRHTKGYDLRYLGTPLELDASAVRTTIADGDASELDNINRTLLIMEVTAITGDQVFQLQGSNNADDTTPTWANIEDEFGITAEGTHTLEFFDYYSKYRIQKLVIDSCTYSSSINESIYQSLHLYKTLELIYQSLQRVPDDEWNAKFMEYKEMYEKTLMGSSFYLDVDADGTIDSDEAKQSTSIINVG